MFVRSLSLSGFRSFVDETVRLDPDLTLLVGENGSGKSTIGVALFKLFESLRFDNADPFNSLDLPYGADGPIRLQAELELSSSETDAVVMNILSKQTSDANELNGWRSWILSAPSVFSFAAYRRAPLNSPLMEWRGLQAGSSGDSFRGRDAPPGRLANELTSVAGEIRQTVAQFFIQNSALVPEFRSRSQQAPSSTLTSWRGNETAGALFNLRNHADPEERQRYAKVVAAFHQLYPSLRIEVVQRGPGDPTPVVQFIDEGRDGFVPIENVGAGVEQVLTALVNLKGRTGLVVFWEHPEQHLHPHAMRFLSDFLEEASRTNQIIVTTHDPHFVSPRYPERLRRVWRAPAMGSQVRAAESLDDRQRGQIQTVWRWLDHREAVFARAVILAEDDSQAEFIKGIQKALGVDLNAHGISVLPVGGQSFFTPFVGVLTALGIPFVALRDLDWGDPLQYPGNQFFSLGAELEEFLDKHGFAERRQNVIQEFGTSKPRTAALLGLQVEPDEVPDILSTLVRAAVEVATGAPANIEA